MIFGLHSKSTVLALTVKTATRTFFMHRYSAVHLVGIEKYSRKLFRSCKNGGLKQIRNDD